MLGREIYRDVIGRLYLAISRTCLSGDPRWIFEVASTHCSSLSYSCHCGSHFTCRVPYRQSGAKRQAKKTGWVRTSATRLLPLHIGVSECRIKGGDSQFCQFCRFMGLQCSVDIFNMPVYCWKLEAGWRRRSRCRCTTVWPSTSFCFS